MTLRVPQFPSVYESSLRIVIATMLNMAIVVHRFGASSQEGDEAADATKIGKKEPPKNCMRDRV